MSKRSYSSGVSKKQRAIKIEINEKKIINALPMLTEFFSTALLKEDINLIPPISHEAMIINYQLQISQNPIISPNKLFVFRKLENINESKPKCIC